MSKERHFFCGRILAVRMFIRFIYWLAFFDLDGSVVSINAKFFREAEIDVLCGDSSGVREELGWEPECSFPQLVSEMCESADIFVKNQMQMIKSRL